MEQDLSKDKFQKRLQQLIDDKYLKQKDLAKEIDVSPAAISSRLKQKTIPAKKHLSKLSDYFGATEDYLKGLTEVELKHFVLTTRHNSIFFRLK